MRYRNRTYSWSPSDSAPLTWGLVAAACVAAGCSSDDSAAKASSGTSGATSGSGSQPDASSGSSSGASGDAGASGSSPDSTAVASDGGDQTPPQGSVALEAWLAAGSYKAWHSEAAIHAQRAPSPHGFDRIYSNAIVNANAASAAEWPVGAAAVKELYNSLTDAAPVGYAVYLKTAPADAAAAGANWYWYERVPVASTAAPHDEAGIVADGLGIAQTNSYLVCVGCHSAAGSDAMHTPTPNGHDFVYTPIP